MPNWDGLAERLKVKGTQNALEIIRVYEKNPEFLQVVNLEEQAHKLLVSAHEAREKGLLPLNLLRKFLEANMAALDAVTQYVQDHPTR